MNQSKIGRGTTPTIRVAFDTVNAFDLTDAYLTLQQGGTIIEKVFDDSNVENNYVEWMLTQEETLKFSSNTINPIRIQCRWKTSEIVGQTDIYEVYATEILKGGVI